MADNQYRAYNEYNKAQMAKDVVRCNEAAASRLAAGMLIGHGDEAAIDKMAADMNIRLAGALKATKEMMGQSPFVSIPNGAGKTAQDSTGGGYFSGDGVVDHFGIPSTASSAVQIMRQEQAEQALNQRLAEALKRQSMNCNPMYGEPAVCVDDEEDDAVDDEADVVFEQKMLEYLAKNGLAVVSKDDAEGLVKVRGELREATEFLNEEVARVLGAEKPVDPMAKALTTEANMNGHRFGTAAWQK